MSSAETPTRAYPPDLTRWVLARWPEDSPCQLSAELLSEVLSTAFYASMMAEEARPTRFRLLLSGPDALPESGGPNGGVLRLRFDQSRALSTGELRRLAPATPFETSLIGVHREEGQLRIWGIAHSGPAWLAPAWGGRGAGSNWTLAPIVHVNAPGQIAVRRGGVLIGALEHGELVDATIDVFRSAWLPARFGAEREEIRTHHSLKQAPKGIPTAVEHSLVGRISQHMLRRVIQLVRSAGHGGLLLIHDDAQGRGGTHGALRLKYRFGQDEPTRRYRTLLLQLLEALADASEAPSIGWADFVTASSMELEQLEQAVFEWSRVVANLAATDGAVVLDKHFALLGFGAEVSAELPTPSRVWCALDNEGTRRRAEDIEAVGTRHRAAYRFVNDSPGSLAIAVSHDGVVTFVINEGGEVVFWEQSNLV
ncbi:MAG: hypothetical protein R3B40_24845 [Polyangiales bacterium]|nr:hypothetical protein [Myxococcales bacterium]MCB9662209.1 hypothetical protein [Sandaracinaceae bacterium]